LRADFRWQHLPVPFELYADGIDLVLFEEFGAGRAALHLKDQVERNRLLEDEAYRRRFRRNYERRFTPRVWHRDLHDAHIVECPDPSVVGKSFGQVADERGIHPVDAYLDLVVAYGPRVRWRTIVANHRPRVLDRLSASPAVHMGFADSGAHLRNMAFYNFPIRFLKRMRDAADRGSPPMSIERAVHRLTGELGEWFHLDAGRLSEGDRGDLVVIDPAALDASVDAYYEAPVPEFGGLRRMVNRSGNAVVAVAIGGRTVYERGGFVEGYGRTERFGRFLRSGEKAAGEAVATSRADAGRVAA
jgi:N-acyl-D-glutamate deacylase